MGFIIALLIILCFGAILSTPIFLFDALVRNQYKNHYEDWVIDGKPNCYFWRIEGFAWKRNWESGKCFMKWIRATPEWMRNDPKALKQVFWFRFS